MAKTIKNNKLRGAEIGAGALAAAALAVAGGYVLWEKMGKQKQTKVKAWVAKARKDAVQNIAKAKKKISETDYRRIVETAVKKYGAAHGVSKEDLVKAKADLTADWKHIQSHAKLVAKELQKQHAGAAKKRTASKHKK